MPGVNRITRVLIVDDSAIVRKILTDTLSHAPDIEVVGTAPDPYIARTKIEALQPDVITLDIEMPRMDGLTFLREIMSTHPLPVIMISSLTQKSCATALEALEAGAVDVMGKPAGPYSVGELRIGLADKVRSAARARVASRPAAKRSTVDQTLKPRTARAYGGTNLIAIGASTGGTEAIREVLGTFPEDAPPVVIVQHIPPVFSKAFADRLNTQCRLRVEEAKHGREIEAGLALIAPGNEHMILRKSGGRLRVELTTGPRVCYQRPSVDVLFRSVAEVQGANAVGVLLTGMGSDGANGLLEMRNAGAATIVQDEASCVVYGMPREAVRLGAAGECLPLHKIADAALSGRCKKAREPRSLTEVSRSGR
jgi:two-component system chemotaxis response regulator CheB